MTESPKRCYRCAADATCEYMGLHYCGICRTVVMEMAWLIPMGPPFGFPGAKGYLPDEPDPFAPPPAESEDKKEAASG